MDEKGYKELPENIYEYLSGNVEQELGLQFSVVINKQIALPMQFFSMEEFMTDYNGAKPIMTVRDDEVKIILVDGASGDTATSKLSIVGAGDSIVGDTNDFGVPCIAKDTASGNAVILPVPLPITDNGGSLTVDASDLDIRDLTSVSDSVLAVVSDGTNTIEINTDGSINITDNNSTISIDDNNSSITVDASDLDIRDLTHASDSVKIGDGNDFLAVNSDGSINVVTNGESGSAVLDYKTSATVGVNNEVLHHYVVTNTKTFWGLDVLVGARGAVKIRVGTSTDGINMSAVKFVWFQDPKENLQRNISKLSLLGDGTKSIVIGITNQDASTSDVYSTLQGREV